MTTTERHTLLAAANKQQDMAAYFRAKGDGASAERCDARAAEMRAKLTA